jgi:hypothetical protein
VLDRIEAQTQQDLVRTARRVAKNSDRLLWQCNGKFSTVLRPRCRDHPESVVQMNILPFHRAERPAPRSSEKSDGNQVSESIAATLLEDF